MEPERTRECSAQTVDDSETASLPVRSVTPQGDSERRTYAVPAVEGYQILEQLGRGGMGTVWRAKQLSTRREVALKLMGSDHFSSERARKRFDREVELTGRLQHPNIARLYDSGLRGGVYFYAMELVDGVQLDAYVAARGLSRRGILEMLHEIARGVQHAHLRGIIHRDLKPSNILVDREGRPRILDFGLAKSFEVNDAGSEVSLAGEVAGTPAYMSPEQAEGKTDQTDTRTDVFSIGVIAYRLLTGHPPHDLSGGHIQVLRRIVEEDVTHPRHFARDIDADLCAMLLKALARNPENRYSTAGDFADDVDRYLNDEPVTALSPTFIYLVGKKLRKHRVAVATAATVLVVIAALLIDSSIRIRWQRNRAVANELAATKSRNAERDARVATDLRLAAHEVFTGSVLSRGGSVREAEQLLWRAHDRYRTTSGSGFTAAVAVADLYAISPPPLRTFSGLVRRPVAVGIIDGTGTVVGVDRTGTISAWDARSAAPGRVLRGAGDTVLAACIDVVGGNVLVVLKPDQAGATPLMESRDVDGKRAPWTLQLHAIPRTNLAVSSDGACAAYASLGSGASVCSIQLVDTRTPSQVAVLACPIAKPVAVTFVDRNQTLICAGEGGALVALRCADGQVSCRGTLDGDPKGLVGSAEAAVAIACTSNGEIHRIDVRAPVAAVTRLGKCPDTSGAIATASGDGRTCIAVADGSGTTLIGADESSFSRFPSGNEQVRALGIGHDGLLVAGTADGRVWLWETRREPLPGFQVKDSLMCAASAPGGEVAVVGTGHGEVWLFDFPTGKLLARFRNQKGAPVRGIKVGTDLAAVCSADADGNLHVTSTSDGSARDFPSGLRLLKGAAFSDDLKRCLCWGPEGLTDVDLGSGAPRKIVAAPVRFAGYLPQRRGYFYTDMDGALVLNRQPGALERPSRFSAVNAPINSAEVFAGGRWIVSGDARGFVRVADLTTGQVQWTTSVSRKPILGVKVMIDPTAALCWDADGRCRVLDLQNGLELHEIASLNGVRDMAVVTGGRGLVACGPNVVELLDTLRPSAMLAAAENAQSFAHSIVARPKDAQLVEAFAARDRWKWVNELVSNEVTAAAIDPLERGRLAWRAGKPSVAAKLFHLARTAAGGASAIRHIDLCIAACERESDGSR